METPTEILSEEHQNILKIIDALTKECNALESGSSLDKLFFEKAIDFIKNYADKFHHAKEENILFVELCKDTVQMHCNPVEQMLYEHDLGRNFVKGIEDGLKDSNKEKIITNARGYAELLKDHIFKEDNILYPMANDALNKKTQQKMLKEFRQIETKRGKDKEKYLAFVKGI